MRPRRPRDKFQSGQATAKKAAAVLVAKNIGFVVPTARQKLNLLVAFAKRNKVIYGKAFDIIRLSERVDLNDLGNVERNLHQVTIFEIKSTRKGKLRPDFSKYFFSLTAAELLVAQSLKEQFRFVLVNTATRDHLELGLAELFSRAKGIYASWSISF